ncbi:transposase [Streptomyces sp. NPDC002144]
MRIATEEIFGPLVTVTGVITTGDNPERLRSAASFAHLCAAAPIPASSGRTNRLRLNPRRRPPGVPPNLALHTIVVVRMRHDRRTQEYVARRTAQGMSKKEIRYVNLTRSFRAGSS